MPNIVYVLTNPTMSGIVKIGMTNADDVQFRMNQLYSTGVPLPFECVIARQIEGIEAAEIEKALHTAFGPSRINPSREFFEIDPEQVEALLRVMPGEDVTPQRTEQEAGLDLEDREANSKYMRRRTLTDELEFMESLSENGIPVYEKVLALGKQDGMQIRWGKKGFSLNAVSNGMLIVVCYGFPPSAYNQSIYTDFASLNRKANVPQDIVETLRKEALETSLFVTAGKGNELSYRTDRRLEESEITSLTVWLTAVVRRIREFETGNSDKV